MAKVFIEETTLTAIGDAIRSKTGKTALIDPAQMHTEIASITTGGGGDIEVEPIVLPPDCSYICAGPLAGSYINKFGSTVSTKNITSASHMFHNSTVTSIPFDFNIKSGTTIDIDGMFYYCENLTHIPDITLNSNTYHDMDSLFLGCGSLKTLPYIYNAYPSKLAQLFGSCTRVRNIPDDYFDTWDFSRVKTNTSADSGAIFSYNYSLRKVPAGFFEKFNDQKATSASRVIYSNLFYCCHALDEVTNLPVVSASLTSNAFRNTFDACARLKRITFVTNADGTPKTAKWNAQTIDLYSTIGKVGYGSVGSLTIYNSGITTDKEVKDDATYQALKNDPDWFTNMPEYSRYNHDSAVETINSLPDVSAGSGNIIKFEGAAGSLTDGGAINTLTEAEIAVAAAKGWTVTLV